MELFGFSVEILGFLFLVGIFAGFIDTLAGGGGLITLPALVMSGLPPLAALGTNKLQGSVGTAMATVMMLRKKRNHQASSSPSPQTSATATEKKKMKKEQQGPQPDRLAIMAAVAMTELLTGNTRKAEDMSSAPAISPDNSSVDEEDETDRNVHVPKRARADLIGESPVRKLVESRENHHPSPISTINNANTNSNTNPSKGQGHGHTRAISHGSLLSSSSSSSAPHNTPYHHPPA